jgi:hypothetical protein
MGKADIHKYNIVRGTGGRETYPTFITTHLRFLELALKFTLEEYALLSA